MTLTVDTRRAFRTPDELAGLVKAVAEAPAGTDETNWVEFKTGLDLEKPHGKFTAARAILAFANRSPKVAAHACEGVAYVIVGAEPQNVTGVVRIDHASLSQKLSTYIDDGPRWTAHYVDYEGKHVLVIFVEPPHDGDRIHALKKALDPAYEGTTYHRRTAQSEPANYQTMQMLQDRLLRSLSEPEFDLDLDVSAEPLCRLGFDRETTDKWLGRREALIRDSAEKPPTSPPPLPNPASVANMSIEAMADAQWRQTYYQKPGEAEEFEQRIRHHLAGCRKRLPKNVSRKIVDSQSNKVIFTVKNGTSKPARAVQLVVRLPLGVAMITSRPEPERLPSFPQWPTRRGWPTAIDPADLPNLTRQAAPPPLTGAPHIKFEQGDDAHQVTIKVGDLTPGEAFTMGPVTVIVGPAEVETVQIQLIGRAMDRSSGSKNVEKSLAVSDNMWFLEDLVPHDQQPS